MEKMNSLNIQERIILQKAKFMFKVSIGVAPCYIANMFNKQQVPYNTLRSSSDMNYVTPRPKLEQFKGSMSFSGPSIWNRIPESIRCVKTVDTFTTNFIRWLKSQR